MDWIEHFQQNGRRRIAIDWATTLHVERRLHGPLVSSLQKFQIGESGEGKHLKARAAATGDAAYAEAVRLFLAEEHVHASYLRRMLDLLGAPTLKAHWSDALFVIGRRLMGLRLELLTLLSAEMVAMYYYRMLRDNINDPLVQRVCAQILRDEAGHVAFHCDYFKRDMSRASRPLRALTRAALRVVHTCAVFVVALDHRDLIVALGIRPSTFLRECDVVHHRVDKRIFSTAPALELVKTMPSLEHARGGGVL